MKLNCKQTNENDAYIIGRWIYVCSLKNVINRMAWVCLMIITTKEGGREPWFIWFGRPPSLPGHSLLRVVKSVVKQASSRATAVSTFLPTYLLPIKILKPICSRDSSQVKHFWFFTRFSGWVLARSLARGWPNAYLCPIILDSSLYSARCLTFRSLARSFVRSVGRSVVPSFRLILQQPLFC